MTLQIKITIDGIGQPVWISCELSVIQVDGIVVGTVANKIELHGDGTEGVVQLVVETAPVKK